jgi:NAD(P)-dependent dehydrogenase (short-subunit alcohol dehydrogenase family)
MFTSIAGRAVVVTGGTRGIGKGIAGVFARNGAKVLITGRDFEVARAAADELSAQAAAAGQAGVDGKVSFVLAGFPGWTHYGASKAGQLGFMRSAAIELAPKGITVNAVLPGNVVTERPADPGKEYTSGFRPGATVSRRGSGCRRWPPTSRPAWSRRRPSAPRRTPRPRGGRSACR